MAIDTDVLQRWRESLQQEMEEIKGRIRPLQEHLAQKQEELSAVEKLLSLHGEVPQTPALPSPGPGNSPPFLDSAYRALQDEEAPLHYRVLYGKLEADAQHVPGSNPAANLLTHMNRDSRFVRVGRGTYALAEWGPPRQPRKSKRRRRRSRR